MEIDACGSAEETSIVLGAVHHGLLAGGLLILLLNNPEL